ncbi:MAG: type II toxin-antitoxin system prevent-host-death family antitoxin [Phycisphaerae bacterium]
MTTRTDDIRPLSVHRAKIREDLERVQRTGRPMFITTNGHTAGVLLSPKAYDALVERAILAEDIGALRQAMVDSKSGRSRDAKEVIQEIAAKIGVEFHE